MKNDKPKVVFQSAYVLTAAQEGELIDHAMARIDDLSKELGRDRIKDADWYSSSSVDQVNAGAKTFLGKRQIFDLIYEQEMEWRSSALGGIYAESNWTVPISRRIVTQEISRANAHFFGTDPWLSADIEGGSPDAEKTKNAERWTRSKFRDAGIKSVIESAVEQAFVQGESVIKRTWREETDIYQAEVEVLIDATTGSPVMDSMGEFITRERLNNVYVQKQLIEPGPAVKAFKSKAPIEEEVFYLKDDPATAIPKNYRFEKRRVSRRATLYRNIYAEICYFKDILIPLTARDVESADFLAHLYDIPVADLADQWNRERSGATEPARNVDTENAVSAINQMRGNSGDRRDGLDDPHTAASSYRMERSEDEAGFVDSGTAPVAKATAKIAECWLRFDANNDGIMENILLVIDTESRTPIFYDYTSNITPDGRRPFQVIRINPIKNRWYGCGTMQIFRHIQNICDLQVNRANFAKSSSGRMTFVNRSAIKGGAVDQDFEINWGETYELEEGYTAEQAVSYVTLPDVKTPEVMDMLKFYLQMALNMSGVQHANDAQLAGLASAKNATSIISLDKSGHEMFGRLLSHLEAGIDPLINALAELCVANMAETETYAWTDEDRIRFGEFTRAQMGESRLRLRLILSRYKAEQEKVALGAVIDRAKEFYELPDPIREKLAPLYRQYVRAFDVAAADSIIDPSLSIAVQGGDSVAFDPSNPDTYGDPGDQPDLGGILPQIEGGIKGGLQSAGVAAE